MKREEYYSDASIQNCLHFVTMALDTTIDLNRKSYLKKAFAELQKVNSNSALVWGFLHVSPDGDINVREKAVLEFRANSAGNYFVSEIKGVNND